MAKLEFEGIDTLVLHSDNATLDILDLLIQFVLYEDIDSPYLTASLFIKDMNNLLEILPLQGSEEIFMSWRSNEFCPKIELVFDVYSIGKVEEFDKTKLIELKLATKPFAMNNNIKLSKKYKGSTSDIVKDIATNVLKIEDKLPGSGFEFSDDEKDIIAPNVSPFTFIEYLCKHAYRDGDASYVFYETTKGHEFISYKQMNQFPIEFEFFYKPKRDKLVAEPDLINKYTILNMFDVPQGLSKGMYKNKVISHDIIRKNINETDKSHQGNELNLNSVPLFQRDEYSEFSNVSIVSENYENKNINETIHLNKVQKLPFSNYTLLLDLRGNSYIRIGLPIYINIPSTKVFAIPAEDKQLSGKYMIFKIKHILNKTDYKMVLEVHKESTLL